jgi:quercetin dioxygenase-like cupin family protein
MKKANLKDMIKGWFIGDFDPTLHKTTDVEVAVKEYKEGDYEGFHHHKVATEFTVILDGSAKMSGKIYTTGDIIKIEPNESTDFKALSDLKTVVVKIPGAKNDKYIDEE